MNDIPLQPPRLESDAPEGFHCGMVAIIGRPNVDRSTLIDTLMDQKVNTTPRKAQTTRHRITGIQTTNDAQLVFIGTPGFQTRHAAALDRSLNCTMTSTFTSVDTVLLIVETGRYDPDDKKVLSLLPRGMPVILTINKVDRLDAYTHAEVVVASLQDITRVFSSAGIVPVSTKNRDDTDRLFSIVHPCLPEGEPMCDPGALIDCNERFLAVEIVREKVFRWTGDELSYSSTVAVDKFEPEGRLRRMFVTILIDRDAHKAMIIGARDAKFKQISTKTRIGMERLFDSKVYLEVWIKVRSGRVDNEAGPHAYGYKQPLSRATPCTCSMVGRSDPTLNEVAEWLAEEGIAGVVPRKNFPTGRPGTHIAVQPAFILYSYPYRETNLIIDVFTPDYGHVVLVARKAKRPRSALRTVLQTFQPPSLSWSGRGDVYTLTRAEWVGGMLPLGGERLFSGFYLGELLIKFIAREDGRPVLFIHYVETLNELVRSKPMVFTLRTFRRVLLRETGFAAQLDRCIGGEPVQADAEYIYHPE